MRIGVFFCECGPHIKDALELQELVRFVGGLPHVAWTGSDSLLCSEKGRESLGRTIFEHRLDRVVIAACSPKEHEHTFQEAMRDAGLNPYLLQIANIREQCAWVTPDKGTATEKAKALISAAVSRVSCHEPLERTEIFCVPDVLVVGAGVAGISAALTLSQKHRRVYVVERKPCIGGKAALFGDLFPHLECSSCVWEASLDSLLNTPEIEVLTCSEVIEVAGFWGNFVVKVKQNARLVDPSACVGCGLCKAACPVSVENEFNEGLDERKAVYIPYPGSLPHAAVIDKDQCTRFRMDDDCQACGNSCPFGAVNYEERDLVREIKVGAVILATGFDLFDVRSIPRYGYGIVDGVYTGLEFERLLSSSGPSEGKILLKDGQPPRSIAIVHCVGSRTRLFQEYCSEVCCRYSLKIAHHVLQQVPGIEIIELFSDLCLPGQNAQTFFEHLRETGEVTFVRLKEPDSVRIAASENRISVAYLDSCGQSNSRIVDMVVLSTAITGAKTAVDLARVFDLPQDKSGFFQLGQPATDPVGSPQDGIFVAGCAQRPMDIASAVAQGQAAAGRILARLIPGERISLEPCAAVINEALCSSCKACVEVCGYKAVECDPQSHAIAINVALCRGCGICASVCPAGAIKVPHFSYSLLCAEICGLTAEDDHERL